MTSTLRTAVCAAAIATIAVVPIVTVTSADAAPTASRQAPTIDFTAGVRSIHHASGTVTLAGTAPVGTSVELAGDVLEPAWTEADGQGAWSGKVRIRPGERHVVRVSSPVSGRVIEIPVEALITIPPTMGGSVDPVARSLRLDGLGHPGAHFVVKDNGQEVGGADVDPDGQWHSTVRHLAFGQHHIEASEYFDGTENGSVQEVYELSGAADVSRADASRESDRVTLAGTAPTGTTLTFASLGAPVLAADGQPLRTAVGEDGRWQVAFPIPADARLMSIDVTTLDGTAAVGSTTAHVTVPIALRGTLELQDDGTIVATGSGELGGVVALETEDGAPVHDADGAAVETVVGPPAQQHGFSWRLAVSPDVLPRDAAAVVVRQRVKGVEQGALRLVLPGRPHRPDPGHGTGPGISSGTHVPTPHASSARIRGGHGRLAYTGTDPVPAVALAGLLTALGSGLLVVSRAARRRRLHR